MMTNRLPLATLAALALALSACGGGKEAHQAEPAAEAKQTAPNSMASLPGGDIARGRAIAETKTDTRQACKDCHGAAGNKPTDSSFPYLAGQYADYLAHTIQMYRNGDREHPVMNIQAKTLTDQDIVDVATYYGAQAGQLHDLSP